MAVYYNQNNYPNNPYPSSANPDATIKSGGCGPTSMAMIVSNLISQSVDPVAMAAFAINCGARVAGGTDMNVLAKAVCSSYGLTYTTTDDENTLLQHLNNGGMAIANVGGDRSGYTGVFSNGGHYIVVYGVNGNKVVVLDPGYYSGKFNKTGRTGKVSISGEYYLVTDISVLAPDTANRSPQYWLFKKVIKQYKPVNIRIGSRAIQGYHVTFDGQDRACAMAAQVAQAFGLQFEWKGDTNTLIIYPYVGPAYAATQAPKVIIVGQVLPSVNINGHIYVPVGLIGAALGRKVAWDQASNTAIVQ